jgi:neutral ceramidase
MPNVSRRSFIKSSALMAGAGLSQHALAARAEKTAASGTGDTLYAGVATRDITPGPGVPMWGYGDRPGPSTGTLDPLLATAIVLRVGEFTLAIATMDVGRVPTTPACDMIRKRVKKAGVDDVIFSASHTHGGPAIEIEGPSSDHIHEGIAASIEAAAADLKPARLGRGTVTLDISHNRRKILDDGRVLMRWRNAERKPTSPIDHEAVVFKLDAEDGTPIATVVHFACHPVVLAGDNTEYSADWVGEMKRVVREATGAECAFIQGGCGDINPYLDKTPRDAGGVESMRATGQAAGHAVVTALSGIDSAAPASPSIQLVRRTVDVGLRWDMSDKKQLDVFRGIYGDRFSLYLDRMSKDMPVPMSTLLLNGEHGFAFTPGEFFIQHQLDLKHRSPLDGALLCGYADDFHLYFPTIRDAVAGGYGGSSATYVGVGAAEKLIAQAMIDLGELTGRLKDFMGPEEYVFLEAEPADA